MNKTNLQPLIDEIIKNNFENELFELNKFFLENGLSIFKDVQKDINEIVYQMIVECVVDIYQSKREVYRKQGYNHTERINFFFKEMEETFFYDEFSAKYPVLINLINIRCLDFIEDDELLEVTPKNLRLRKRYLDSNERKRHAKNAI